MRCKRRRWVDTICTASTQCTVVLFLDCFLYASAQLDGMILGKRKRIAYTEILRTHCSAKRVASFEVPLYTRTSLSVSTKYNVNTSVCAAMSLRTGGASSMDVGRIARGTRCPDGRNSTVGARRAHVHRRHRGRELSELGCLVASRSPGESSWAMSRLGPKLLSGRVPTHWLYAIY